ncbi:MAG: PAS domain-containing protein [Gemmatimonadota bacterium]
MPPSPLDLADVFAAIPIPATLVDAGGTVVAVNQAFVEHARGLGFAVDPAERIGRPIGDPAVRDGSPPGIERFVAAALAAAGPLRRRERCTDADDRPIHVDLQASPLRDPSGRVLGAIVLRQDVTDQVRDHRLHEVTAQLRHELDGMRGSDDLERLLVAVRDGLAELEVPFANCGVNLVDESTSPPSVLFHTMRRDGYWRDAAAGDPGTELILGIWRDAQIAYRVDLAGDDVHGESDVLSRGFGQAIRAVVDVPFSHGTLAVNSTRPNAFTAADIDAFQAMAQVLSEAFTRLQEIRRLEARNRELLQQIHQRLQAEEARRQSEQLYRELVENLPLGVSHTTPEGRLIYQNPAALRIHGYSREELDRMSARDLYLEPTDCDDLLRRLRDEGRHHYEVRLRHRNGHAVWTRNTTTVVRDSEGQVLYFLGLSEDVTEQRRHEARHQAVQRLRDEVWRMERETDFQRVIGTFRSCLELMEVPADGCSIHVIDAATDPPTVNSCRSRPGEAEWEAGVNRMAADSILANWRRGEPVYRRDLDRDDPLGETRYIRQVYRQPVRSVLDVPFSQGTVGINSAAPDAFAARDVEALQALAGVLSEGFRRLEDLRALERRLGDLEREIAERRQLEGQLRQAQKMEAVGQLTAGLAHNFNNMLQGVVGNVSLALMQAPPELHEVLVDANRSADRAAAMIRHLLVFARQGVQPELRPVDLAALLGDAVEMVRRTFDRRIAVSYDPRDIAADVMGDPGQLEQVFLNLFINARDALEGAAEPAIRVDLDELEVRAGVRPHPEARPGAYVLARIADNGVGMDDATRERVFEPFFTTKDVDKGTGLGLSTVYGIVQQHGGWVDCRSQPGRGATFSVYLPLAAPAGQDDRVSGDGAAARGSETILIIDDEDIVRRTASRLLEHYGYSVLLAEDGPAGLELFERHCPGVDLVLLDLSMPRMTGREVLARLQALDPGARVVFFTGYAAEGQDPAGDVVDVIQKPFTSAQLAEAVRAALDR